jgi:DNA repair protein RadC
MTNMSYEEAKELIEKAARLNPFAAEDFRQFSVMVQHAITAFGNEQYLFALKLKTRAMAMREEKHLADVIGVIDALVTKLESIDFEGFARLCTDQDRP